MLFKVKLYGEIPPLTSKEMIPELSPKQIGFEVEIESKVISIGSEIIILPKDSTQLSLSLI